MTFARKTLLLLGAIALPLAASAAPPKPKAPPVEAAPPPAANAPKLVVAIAMDQFSADLFAQYRSHFTGGLARLASGSPAPFKATPRPRPAPAIPRC